MPNAQYNVASADGLAAKIAAAMRRQMFLRFVELSGVSLHDTVADVGATSDRTYDHSNYVEAWLPRKERITSIGIDDAAFLETLYPGLRFVRADGRDLPFEDASFDFVHSSAVLEHVGSASNQQRFIREMWRVARKGIFATTPNRWFPVEFHTILPLVHWLPAPWFRALLRSTGREFFADERNLNLMNAATLRRAALEAGVPNPQIGNVAILGWPTNLLLVAKKS